MSYVSAIEAMGIETLLETSTDDYQGDTYLIVKEQDIYPGRYGFLQFGWGSCSGCDAWQGAESATERATIILDVLQRGAFWAKTLEEVQAHVGSADRDGSYYASDKTWLQFRAEAAAL